MTPAPHAGDPLVEGTAAEAVVRALTASRATVATAESLTAGLLAATLAGVPGASAVLRGGLVVYATDLKAALAGVPQATLDAQGPVAADTVRALAAGARGRCGATWGVALTGVAGPTEQDGHPVGTVFLGLSSPHGDRVHRLALRGSRWEIRSAAVREALAALLAALTPPGSADDDEGPR